MSPASDERGCGQRALVDGYFAARSDPEAAAAMHGHLSSCAACQGYYDRHLLLSELDPASASAKERIAAAIGLGGRRRGWPQVWTMGLALGTAAAALALFVGRAPEPGENDFAARGSAAARPASLEIYCTSCGKPAPRVAGALPAQASLAFAYHNPTGWKRLMVLAVDEGRHVYWYHPDPAQSPVAIAIEPGAGAHELPWEIDQSFHGRTLRILGVFTDDALAASKVEAQVDARGCASVSALAGACVEQVVTIAPEGSR
jgi:hypothetical protein